MECKRLAICHRRCFVLLQFPWELKVCVVSCKFLVQVLITVDACQFKNIHCQWCCSDGNWGILWGVKLDVSVSCQKVLIVCYPSNPWEFCRCRRQSGVLLNYQAQSLSSAESFSKRIEMGVSRSLNPNSIKHWHLKAWTRVVWQTLVGPLWFTFTLEFLGPWRVYVYHMQHDVVIFHHHTWRQLKCRLS